MEDWRIGYSGECWLITRCTKPGQQRKVDIRAACVHRELSFVEPHRDRFMATELRLRLFVYMQETRQTTPFSQLLQTDDNTAEASYSSQ